MQQGKPSGLAKNARGGICPAGRDCTFGLVKKPIDFWLRKGRQSGRLSRPRTNIEARRRPKVLLFFDIHKLFSIKIEKRPFRVAFPLVAVRLVGLFADLPEVRKPRSLSTCLVLLLSVSRLVSGQRGQVVLASCYHAGDRSKFGATLEFFSLHRSRTFYFLTQVQAVAVRTVCLCHAVGRKQHLVAAVLGVRTRFCECTG